MEAKFTALALLLLLFVAWTRVGGRERGPRLLLASTMGLLIGAGAIKLLLGASGYLPNTGALRLLTSVERQMHEALADPAVERILLLEGSSYSARGVDGPLLAQVMSRNGPRRAMIQVRLDGANHFERSWILEHVLDSLSPAQEQRLREMELTLLMEIQRGYDHSPLNGFMRNLGTSRAYAYMDAPNALVGLRAVRSVGAQAPEPLAEVMPHAASHMLVNVMSVGMAYRGVSLEQIKPMSGYQPLSRKKRRYHYRGGMKEVLRQARALNRGGAAGLEIGPGVMAWLEGIRVPRYRRILGDLVDREAWYAIPSTETADLRYVEAFCDRQGSGAICIRYSDPRLLRRLDRVPDWNDARHMRVSGARKFTRWFARRYLRDVARSDSR